MSRMLIVDACSLIFRSWYATHYANNQYDAAIHLYMNWYRGFIRDYHPDYTINALDVNNKQSENFNLNDDYKADRGPIDSELRDKVFPTDNQIAVELGYNHVGVDGNEADDVIGSAVKKYKNVVDEIIVISNDRDILQVVDDDNKVCVISLLNKGGRKIWHNKDVTDKFKIHHPSEVATYKALAGDSSDNYKGVPGIGGKFASELVLRYGTVDKIYEAIDKGVFTRPQLGTLMENRQVAFDTYKLAKLNDTLPIPELDKLTLNYQYNLQDKAE